MKTSPEVHLARGVVIQIKRASEALRSASAATEDATLRQYIEKARRPLPDALKRARAVLEHVGGTEQLEIP